jgi:membrane-bound lytic murein transglycosylase B
VLALVAGLVGGPTIGPVGPVGAAAPASASPGSASASIAETAVPPVLQVPGAGPYEPGFIDEPLPTNPPSASLEDVRVQSAELDQVEGILTGAENRRDAAIGHRDELRQHIVDLGEQRAEAVAALAQRQVEERQRGEERAAAVAEHERRVAAAERAADRLEEARDTLRELMVAAYLNESSATEDALVLLASGDDVDAAMLRLQYSSHAVDGRVADVEARVRDRQEAVAAEDRAADARAEAEQAERDAVAARQGAEQHIVDIDAETVQTQEAEVEAVAALADREADVLLAAAEIAPARLRADLVGDGLDFPLVALDAWLKAAATAPCRMEWWMLAGISKIEGRHGTHGGGHFGARGYPSVKIIGPQLNGGPFAAVGDTDDGRYDGDPVWDRAVGPMQFIPSTWAAWGRDGDGDLVADPFTVYDAAAGAAAYLCAGRTDLTDEAQLRAGYLSYNHSGPYVEAVLRAARGYQAALQVPPHVPVDPLTGEPIVPPPVAPPGSVLPPAVG